MEFQDSVLQSPLAQEFPTEGESPPQGTCENDRRPFCCHFGWVGQCHRHLVEPRDAARALQCAGQPPQQPDPGRACEQDRA